MITEKEQTETALKIVKSVADAIKELGSIPSGHLYARLMAFLTLDQYNQIIGFLKRAELIKEEHHEITWIA